MTSPHQASSSVSRNGCPPTVFDGGVPPRVAVFGTGTSIVRTAGFSTVFGYRRCTLTWRESGSSTGANLDVLARHGDVGELTLTVKLHIE